jgi:methionyl-tRNA formyltransferase
MELAIPTTETVADVVDSGAELGLVVAFGRLVRPAVLERLPMLNVHFSLLPRWRGAAPVERAILAGDTETGVSIMALEEGLDTGPVYASARTVIDDDESADELTQRLGRLGAKLVLELLDQWPVELAAAIPQEGEPVYASKLAAHEHEIDWSQSAAHCQRVVRVGHAWTTFRGRRLVVRRARLVAGASVVAPAAEPGQLHGATVTTGDGLLELVEVQPEGRSAVAFDSWAHGARPWPGEQLGRPVEDRTGEPVAHG